jgi:hypothetical protein
MFEYFLVISASVRYVGYFKAKVQEIDTARFEVGNQWELVLNI